MSFSFCPKYYKLPVTALAFCGDLILAGSGGNVKIYDTKNNNTFVKEVTIFKHSVIHGIKIFKLNACNILIIFGAREICIQNLNFEKETVDIEVKHCFTCSDWILDAVPISSENGLLLAVALAHNSVVLCDIYGATKTIQECHCTEKCILYSAHFININNEFTLDGLILCGGTVFNQVVVWKPTFNNKISDDERAPVMTRLYGHDGVVFSISYNHQTKLFLSASDDRSIRIWNYDITNTNNETCDCSCVLYGHEARVWNVESFKRDNNKYVASVAEDGFLIIWKLMKDNNYRYTSSIMRKLNCGGNLLSLCLKDTNGLCVGGNDGGIRVFKIGKILNSRKIFVPEKWPDHYGVIKTVELLVKYRTSVLFHTNIGTLGIYDIANQKWKILQDNKKNGSYASVNINKNEDLVAIGNTKGNVQIILLSQDYEILSSVEFDGFKGKILNTTWFENNLFLSGLGGEVIWYSISHSNQELTVEKQLTFILPHAKHRWHTDILITFINGMEYLICGDRRGSIHLFKKGVSEPVQTLHGLHGKHGVTSLQQHQQVITSTGRDGFWRQYRVEKDKLCLLSKNRAMQGMDWLEGFTITANNRMYIHGFHGNKFVVWSKRSGDEMFSILCGGCHRSWGFSALKSKFVFLKAGQLNICQIPFDVTSESLIDSALHTQQTNCVKLLGNTVKDGSNEVVVVATAGEDTRVNISVIWNSDAKSQFEVLNVLSDHSSNVRNISVLNQSSEPGLTEVLMCTVGSKATLNIYKVIFDSDSISQNKCTVQHIGSYCNSVKDKSDVRFMAVKMWKEEENNHTMAVACSDGTILCLQLQNHTIREICKSKEYHHCFLAISRFNNLLISGSTNGHIYFMSDNLEEISSLKCHQSGINSIAVESTILNGRNYGILVTGGDDNSIHLAVFLFEENSVKIETELLVENAHWGQITGVHLSKRGQSFVLTSVAIDQRLTQWDVGIEVGGRIAIHCRRKWTEVTFIADASSLEVNNGRLLMSGRGILYGVTTY